jgi:hypothetical protein
MIASVVVDGSLLTIEDAVAVAHDKADVVDLYDLLSVEIRVRTGTNS